MVAPAMDLVRRSGRELVEVRAALRRLAVELKDQEVTTAASHTAAQAPPIRAESPQAAGGRGLKRATDLLGTALLLPPCLPLMGVLAMAVRLDSPGPVLFRDRRLGRAGRVYSCYKLRTMHVNGDAILAAHLRSSPEAQAEWDRFRKLRDYDPRITRVGRFLRKWSLDEIPQILNILCGEMSLVGPRPYRESEGPLLEPYRETILSALPGVTGLWQVMGRNEIPFGQRVLLDAWYARHQSFWLDLVLLLRTVKVVILRKGAY
jgi:lipopolysaccharide/colanic/teichoic acid biosynthesis glycosyltransferase